MFKNNKVITGLDIGTDSIKVLVAVKEKEDSELEVLAQIIKPCSGVRKGVVVKPEKVSEEIRSSIDEALVSSGQKINSVYSNINGSHFKIVPSRGVIAVSRADREISQEDIERVIQNAQTISLPSNEEIIDVYPKEFIIDDESGIKEAVGMKGTRLEAEVLLLCVFSPYLQNLTKSITGAGFQINNIQSSPIAAARAVLTPQQKELGVVSIDIGADTTGMAVFEEENLIHAAIFPIGSNNITKDVAICLKCDFDLAEKIKRDFGTCNLRGVGEKQKRSKSKIKATDSLSFSRKLLSGVIEARVSEIFDQVNKELKKISRQKLLPAGIVITGGGARLPKIVDLAKKELKLPCRIGRPRGFIGLNGDPTLATVCGLVLSGVDSEREEGFSDFGRGITDKLKGFFRIFIP